MVGTKDYWYNGHVDGHGIYSFSRIRTDRGSTFSLIPMHSELGWYPWTMVYATSSTEICRVPSPLRASLHRSFVFSHAHQVCGVAPIKSRERTSVVLTRRACVRACLPRVSARERVSWVPLEWVDWDVWVVMVVRFQVFEQVFKQRIIVFFWQSSKK